MTAMLTLGRRPAFQPGARRRRGATDLDEITIRPLGVRDSVYYYLSWATGEIVALKPNDHTKNQLKNLAPAEYWSAYYADEDGKLQWDNAVTDLMDACQKAGKFNPDHMRGLGAWIEPDPVTRDERVVSRFDTEEAFRERWCEVQTTDDAA